MYYVYVLYSKKLNRLYKDYCSVLERRIKQHQSGRVKSTKLTKDWELIYYQVFINKTDALREEKFLKTGKGKES
jgi:putative endonuclease